MGIVKKLSLCMDKKWVSPIFKGGLNLKNYKKFFINIFIPLFYGTYNDLILQKYTIAKTINNQRQINAKLWQSNYSKFYCVCDIAFFKEKKIAVFLHFDFKIWRLKCQTRHGNKLLKNL